LVGRGARLNEAETEAFWSEVGAVQPFFAQRSRIVWRLCPTPSQAPSVAHSILSALQSAEFYFDWGGGLIWLALPHAPDAHAALVRGALQGQAGSQSGHATLIRAELSVRRAVPVFQPEPPALAALSRRVKASFDPLAILNRGRMG